MGRVLDVPTPPQGLASHSVHRQPHRPVQALLTLPGPLPHLPRTCEPYATPGPVVPGRGGCGGRHLADLWLPTGQVRGAASTRDSQGQRCAAPARGQGQHSQTGQACGAVVPSSGKLITSGMWRERAHDVSYVHRPRMPWDRLPAAPGPRDTGQRPGSSRQLEGSWVVGSGAPGPASWAPSLSVHHPLRRESPCKAKTLSQLAARRGPGRGGRDESAGTVRLSATRHLEASDSPASGKAASPKPIWMVGPSPGPHSCPDSLCGVLW